MTERPVQKPYPAGATEYFRREVDRIRTRFDKLLGVVNNSGATLPPIVSPPETPQLPPDSSGRTADAAEFDKSNMAMTAAELAARDRRKNDILRQVIEAVAKLKNDVLREYQNLEDYQTSVPAGSILEEAAAEVEMTRILEAAETTIRDRSREINELADKISEISPTVSPDESHSGRVPATVVTGLGADIDSIVARSPSLSAAIKRLQERGYRIRYGSDGEGSHHFRAENEVVIGGFPVLPAPNRVSSLAHEVGHADGTPVNDFINPVGMTREQWVSRMTDGALREEARATLTAARARREIIATNGPDIDLAGQHAVEYALIENTVVDGTLSENEAIDRIAALYRNEVRGTADRLTYEEYNNNRNMSFWDQQIAPRLQLQPK